MATWHQMQARKQPGFRLYHDTKWSVLYDPPNEMAGIMLFDTCAKAEAYLHQIPQEHRRHSVILRPAKLTWVRIDEARYDEMLNILPPAVWLPYGFMVGEAWDHDADDRSRFAAFVRKGKHFYEATLPMTVADFRSLDLSSIG